MAIQTGAGTLSATSVLGASATINPTARLSASSVLTTQAVVSQFGTVAMSATSVSMTPGAPGSGGTNDAALAAATVLTVPSGAITGIDNTSSSATYVGNAFTVYQVLWFTFTLPVDAGAWSISTTSSPSAWDSKLMLLQPSGSPATQANLVSLAYNDDAGGGTYLSTMTGSSLSAGTYYICYGGFSTGDVSANGTLTWSGLTGLTTPAPVIATTRGVWQFSSSTGEIWKFPRNPREMTNPMPARKLVSGGRSPINDWIPITAGQKSPQDWSFSGSVKTLDHYNTLISWLNRTEFVYVTDHFQRTWKVRFTKFTLDELRPNSRSDWRFKYTVNCLVYGRTA